jgi:pimeloyl-ACP methyl ester carboxylesterase
MCNVACLPGFLAPSASCPLSATPRPAPQVTYPLSRPFPDADQHTQVRYTSGASLHDVTHVELAYDAYSAPSGNTTDGALVVLHGLLCVSAPRCAPRSLLTEASGSKRNWHSLCKSLAHDLARPVYALDLRNLGHSPAAVPHTYAAMAADVLAFLAAHRLSRVQLLGHSMGGKAAMAAALAAPHALEKLVVADIAPAAGAMSPEFAVYVDAMVRVQEMGLRSRKDAQAVLRETESVGRCGARAGTRADGAARRTRRC